MKLSAYARQVGVSYRTAFRWFKSGLIQGRQMDTGTILITEPVETPTAPGYPTKVAIYTRVPSAENKENLDGQAKRLQDHCAALVKEIGSGVNDTRPKLMQLLTDASVTRIVVEHKDRLTCFGFNYIEQLLKLQERSIEVINLAEHGKEDLVQDLVRIVTSFCACLYGQRGSKRRAERIIAELTHDLATPALEKEST
jgi:predicted site-specific integrase-resolvase